MATHSTESDGVSAGQSAGSDKNYVNYSIAGDGGLLQFRDVTRALQHKLYLSHNQVLIWGEDFAKSGVWKHLDLFARDHEMRLGTYILVAKGTASDILASDPVLKEIPALSLREMLENAIFNSQVQGMCIFDFISAYISETRAPIAPCVELETGADGKMHPKLQNMAVFEKDRMIGSLNSAQSMGYMFWMDAVEGGILHTEMEGESFDVEITFCKSRVALRMDADRRVYADARVRVRGRVGTHTGAMDLNCPENIEKLQNALKEKVRSLMLDAASQASALRADIFGFGERIAQQYPRDWDGGADWKTRFGQIGYSFDVEVTVNSEGTIHYPHDGGEYGI
jgi:Ger(x)C family germination protein